MIVSLVQINLHQGQFKNVNEMNQTIIDNWNDKVGENDIVYHLGDIALYFTKPQRDAYQAILEVLLQLHGHLILIKGNHDNRALFKYLESNNYEFNGLPKFQFHDVGSTIKI
jgi:calcineurin-like phosphoesterase family protein